MVVAVRYIVDKYNNKEGEALWDDVNNNVASFLSQVREGLYGDVNV